MSVDLSRVNVSIQQFQDISSGKYNAGEVKLESETRLGKINNHVHQEWRNAKSLSHEEVLAVKNAFVKALSDSGVGAEEIAAVRRELGLGADAGIDKSLRERSLRPLTRQQVRAILDRNAATINEAVRPGTIRTTDELNAGKDAQTIQNRKDERDRINADLAGARGTQEHEGMAIAEALVAGDVDFLPWEETRTIREHARFQIDQILKKSGGHPSAEREAVLVIRLQSTGQTVSLATGLSEAAFVRRLEETIVRLSGLNGTDDRSIAVRAEFGALADPVARRDWLDGLAGAPDAGFKARTAAIRMLTDAGIGDWETLSLVNRVDDEAALAIAKTLAQLNGTLRGDALRNDPAMQALAHLAQNGPDVPENARAFVPATSPEQWNAAIRSAIRNGKPQNLPHDFRALVDELPARLRGMFGPTIIRPGNTIHDFIGGSDLVDRILPPGFDGRATAENLRARLLEQVDARAAETCAIRKLNRIFMALGAKDNDCGAVLTDWMETRPQLHSRLLAARSAAGTDAVLAEYRDVIEADARRYVAADRGRAKAVAFYKEALARGLGIPQALFGEDSVDAITLGNKAGELARKIRRGEIPVATDAKIDEAFLRLAEDFAAERLAAFRAVDAIRDLPPAAGDALKGILFDVTRVDKVDVARLVRTARSELLPLLGPIDDAFRAGAPKLAVYEAMRPLHDRLHPLVASLFPPGAEVGADEMMTHGRLLMAIAVHSVPGFAERLEAFFARDDVKNDDFHAGVPPASYTGPFLGDRPDPRTQETLAASPGAPGMPPFHAQALVQAFADAGLGALSDAEKMAVLRPSHPAGAAIAAAVRATPGAVSPSRLRELAAPFLRSLAGAAPAARPEADAARMESILARYGGGLDEAGRARLRAFAEGLDFSEDAAPASERAVAARTDEIAGGGAFGNPASSLSRRALAAGFSEADLPALAVAADAAGDAEDVLNPQSAFRRAWDAALLRFAGRPNLVAGLSADAKAAIAQAVGFCNGEPELLAIVTAGIDHVAVTGGGRFREELDIKQAVMDLRANLAELREAAADDPAALAAGLELLRGLEGRSAPAGFVKHMLDAVRRAPIDALAKLRRRSSPAEINRAILQLNANAVSILSGRDSGGLAEDADTALACRHFLLRTMVSRLTESQRRNLREALASQNAVQTAAFYDAVAADEVEMPAMAQGLHEHITTLAASLSRDAGFLYGAVRRSLGEADADSRLPPLQGELDLPGIGAMAMFGQIQNAASSAIAAARDAYLRSAFPGTSPAATAMRGIFATRLAASPSINPKETIGILFAGTTANMLNISLVRGAKQLATARTAHDFALTQFAKDRHRFVDVLLPDGTPLSKDPATAADQLARFATGRADATYAALGGAEKTKVHVLMSLLTQEAASAVIGGPATALDPQGRKSAFSHVGGNLGGNTMTFRLSRDGQGGVGIEFEATLRPTHLLVDGEPVPLGAGSELKGRYALTLSAETLDALGELDFAACNHAAADQVMDGNPPVEQKLRTAVNRLPPAFRLDLEPTTSFSAVLN